MTERYIERRFEDIRKYACLAEERLDDSDCTQESMIRDNKEALEQCQKHGCDYWLIDEKYDVDNWMSLLEQQMSKSYSEVIN